MLQIATFSDAHIALRKFYGAHSNAPYTLARMRQLMKSLGDPQNTLHVIHVAGTSGKTSTAYFITSLLVAAGHKVGLTVSPHVDEVNERVQIDCVPMLEADFCAELAEFLKLVEASKILPSYFECMVAFAYWEFARQSVDYAVVEVGLGGLVDGTNVVSRADKTCVITDIGLDHTEILGDTLAKITRQKAGIILPSNDVYMNEQSVEVINEIEAVCKRKGAGLNIVRPADLSVPAHLPVFQQRNFRLAREVVNGTLSRVGQSSLTSKQIDNASRVYIPARMEIIQQGDKTIIIDGAHNAQKLATLFGSINSRYPGQSVAVLVGFVQGDPFRLHQALETITKHAAHITATSFYSEKDYPKRSVDTTQVIIQCHELGFADIVAAEDPAEALRQLLARPEDILLVTGSFYLLSHIRPLIKELT